MCEYSFIPPTYVLDPYRKYVHIYVNTASLNYVYLSTVNILSLIDFNVYIFSVLTDI